MDRSTITNILSASKFICKYICVISCIPPTLPHSPLCALDAFRCLASHFWTKQAHAICCATLRNIYYIRQFPLHSTAPLLRPSRRAFRDGISAAHSFAAALQQNKQLPDDKTIRAIRSISAATVSRVAHYLFVCGCPECIRSDLHHIALCMRARLPYSENNGNSGI